MSEYTVDALGHRVVHGGPDYHEPQLITETVIEAIRAYIPDAPMHNPYSLAAIEAAAVAMPGIPQVAVFDTAFHARMPRRSINYAIDQDVANKHGIRRYGFHGISHEYAAGIALSLIHI